ncbi:TPA: hypothetical protein EYN09_05350 [Candidatus Poribacteria bacterium]|nr:hypothetical protein [Candidatus Poribacteria bacterium]HIO78999.1 hypothetical protein [Candidatus Poribacteria bacterium]
MVKRSVVILMVMMVISVGLLFAEDTKEVVVKKAKELKGTKAKKITWKKDGAKMVRIPGNLEKKVIATASDEFGDLVSPEKEVVTKIAESFYMDVYEVTVGQFKKFLNSSGYKPLKSISWDEVYQYSPTDKHPMIYVSWHDATAYAKWAGKRLPTESEWEFATRGGLVDKEFPWGGDEGLAREYANYEGTGGKDQWNDSTAPVGSFKPNGYGLFDMAGNVSEWCQDWYNDDHFTCVLRGGSWCNLTYPLRVAYRLCPDPHHRSYIIGFRCVVRIGCP